MPSRLYLFLVILVTVIQAMVPQWLADAAVNSLLFFRAHGRTMILIIAGTLCALGLCFLPAFPAWGAP